MTIRLRFAASFSAFWKTDDQSSLLVRLSPKQIVKRGAGADPTDHLDRAHPRVCVTRFDQILQYFQRQDHPAILEGRQGVAQRIVKWFVITTSGFLADDTLCKRFERFSGAVDSGFGSDATSA